MMMTTIDDDDDDEDTMLALFGLLSLCRFPLGVCCFRYFDQVRHIRSENLTHHHSGILHPEKDDLEKNA